MTSPSKEHRQPLGWSQVATGLLFGIIAIVALSIVFLPVFLPGCLGAVQQRRGPVVADPDLVRSLVDHHCVNHSAPELLG